MMGIEDFAEFRIVAFYAENCWLLCLQAFLVPMLLLTGIRFQALLGKQSAWILTGVRVLFGYLPIAFAIFLGFLTISAIQHNSLDESLATGFWVAIASGIAIGLVVAFYIGRKIELLISNYLDEKSLNIPRDEHHTDIRTIKEKLLVQPEVNHANEFDCARRAESVFLGIDEKGKSVTIDRSTWKRSHVQIMGPPGSGKGVQAAVALSQSLLYGDAVYIFDPKRDEWAPSVFWNACKNACVPFYFVNLQEHTPQLNPLAHASETDISEMFYAAFQLSSKGEAADFYRLGDREAVRQTAVIANRDSLGLSELPYAARSKLSKEVLQSAQGFLAHLDEISNVPCVRTREGIDLATPLEQGGCIYIVGSTRNEPVVYLQKLIFVRLIQLIEQRDNPNRHASIFLDEFKYLLSTPAVNALGTIRDKACNILLAHQSLGDFKQCGADLPPDSVQTTITDTTPLKWLYRPSDENTATWISNQTGTIPAYQKHLTSKRNPELVEIESDISTSVVNTRSLIDKNTVLCLPNGAAVCIGAGVARIAFASPIVVDKVELKPESAEPVEVSTNTLLERIDSLPDKQDGLFLSTTDLAGPECVPEIRILGLLYDVAWTHENIVAELLPQLSREEIRELVTGLESHNAISKHTVRSNYGINIEVFGIRAAGIEMVRDRVKPKLPSQKFLKNRVNPASLEHHLDQQRLRIVAERTGWTCWRKGSLGRKIVKGENYPDAIAVKPDGTIVAVELERTAKDIARYHKIIVAHLESRKQRLWDEIYYIFPDNALLERVKKMFDEIKVLNYLGNSIQFTNEYRSCFRFFTFDDDWCK